jgi:hypothetical protein
MFIFNEFRLFLYITQALYIYNIYINTAVYGSTALCSVVETFSVSSTCTQSVELFGRRIGTSQDPYLHHKHRINTRRHPCLEWDSNPRSPVFEWRGGGKTVHALDGAVTVIGNYV